MSAFPAPYTQVGLATDAGMQKALAAAVAKRSELAAVPITIVQLPDKAPAPGAKLLSASSKGDEIHFSASLVKVAAMYASFELRAAARRALPDAVAKLTAGRFDVSDKQVQAGGMVEIAAAYTTEIGTAALALPLLKTCPTTMLLPSYGKVFEVNKVGSDWVCDFTSLHREAMAKMIIPSDNTMAAQTIHGVGYGYINAALKAAGFLDPTTPRGIWLAGDYIGQWPYFRIQSVNDKGVAQAATTNDLARLYALAATGFLVDADSSTAMLELLRRAYDEGQEYFLTRPAGLSYTQTHTKVGLAPLKSGQEVASEASIIVGNINKKRFVVAWQNVVTTGSDSDYEPVARAIDEAIQAAP
jgi:hypothetical protein